MDFHHEIRPSIAITRILGILLRAAVKVALAIIGLSLLAVALSLETTGLGDLIYLVFIILGVLLGYLAWRIPY